jgi:hypothetical protein
MSEQSSPAPGDEWGYAPIGRENIPVHCGGFAYHDGDGHWACAACDAPVHVRDIPGWTPRIDTQPAPTTPGVGAIARG